MPLPNITIRTHNGHEETGARPRHATPSWGVAFERKRILALTKKREHQPQLSGQISAAIQAKLQQGYALHQQGRLADAERLYQEVLRHEPRHFDALHLLGIVALQTRRTQRGVELIKKAIRLNANDAAAHNDLAMGLMELRRYDEALANYDKAILLRPGVPEAYNNRGNALQELKRFADALASYDRAIALKPDFAGAYNNRGNALQELKRYEEALANYDKALALRPDYAVTYNNRGNALKELKRFEDALASYDKALTLKPDYPEAHNNRGVVLRQLNRLQEALVCCDKALALQPDYAEAHNNRGNALRECKRFDEALESFAKATAFNPHYAWAHNNRGTTLQALKRFEEALTAFDKALALERHLAEAWLGRGNVFIALKRYDDAFAAYGTALELKPSLADAWLGRGRSQLHRGKLEEGRKDYEQALALGANGDAVTYDLARFGLIEAPPVLPRSVVIDLFDGYAVSFDEHLLHQLKYEAPADLSDLIHQHCRSNSLDILDIGCGTGLMGAHLRSMAKTLVGVDLSQRMLDLAKRRAIYDSLICKEIVEFLADDGGKYDLIVSTDVFIYCGDLTRIFSLVHRRLNENGYFGFSVESTTEGDYCLRETGRYQHSRKYLEELALRFGFRSVALEECVIREESNVRVPGLLAVMRRD